MRYEVEDWVYIRNSSFPKDTRIGKVLWIKNTGSALIEFVKNIGGHSGNTICPVTGKDGHCWWVVKKDITRVFKTKPTKKQIEELLVENEI